MLLEEAFFQAVEWLDVCGRNGITLNLSKFLFAKTTVEFASFEMSMHPCPHYFETIQNFPTPRNITDFRSWFGLVNQVAYAFASTERVQPFGHLLKPGTCFEWTKKLDHLPFCCNEGWKITLVGSRFTSGAESHYAPVEGEALAAIDALDKARHSPLRPWLF
ncbi:hypothetical protein Pmani_004175 [Petrolisthes manimaculis]|uniref:Reverse transcriptase RNase H-like domain-containing protein n=1 Tax=Petrolisthes manimaculis TaxID=1843537 RepID=A0AAE1QE54_9EUCA|nr:hypothetical protein Pmani_004175 [Petrolisthes manimaculis]